MPADLILRNGQIVTMEAEERGDYPTALAVGGGRILAVGDEEMTRAYLGAKTGVYDLAGATVLPGLTDAHVHFAGIGLRLLQINCFEQARETILAQVRERAQSVPAGTWIRGRGWNHTLWKNTSFPSRTELDAVAPDHPVVLTRVDGHATWVNSLALKLAGVGVAYDDPPGGHIVRENDGRTPAGVLVDRAMGLVNRAVPGWTDEELDRAAELASQELLSQGITSVHDAGVDSAMVARLDNLVQSDRVQVRLYEMIRWQEESASALEYLERGPVIRKYDGHLSVRAVKISIDGALGSRGAALFEPYEDDPENRGLIRVAQEDLVGRVTRVMQKGWQVALHAIGDRANHLGLEAIERALAVTEDGRRTRPRIEHAQIMRAGDFSRFRKSGVIPSMQPRHATSDMNVVVARIGLARARYSYAWRTFLDLGLPIPGGSDAPVEPTNPFLGIYAAVTRCNAAGEPAGGWHPEQKASRREALRMFTRDAAYAAFEEDVRGSIREGKYADLVVVDRNPLSCAEHDLLNTRVLYTFVGGKLVYG